MSNASFTVSAQKFWQEKMKSILLRILTLFQSFLTHCIKSGANFKIDVI